MIRQGGDGVSLSYGFRYVNIAQVGAISVHTSSGIQCTSAVIGSDIFKCGVIKCQ